MEIANLPYFQNVSEAELITGGAGAFVDASATAEGTPSSTLTQTSASARLLPSGTNFAFGRGFAAGRGESPTADVTVAGEGNIVAESTRSRTMERIDTAIALGIVVAFN